jgi:hypothetical protein
VTKQNRYVPLFILIVLIWRRLEAPYLEALDVAGAAKNLDSVRGLCNGSVVGEALLVGDERNYF